MDPTYSNFAYFLGSDKIGRMRLEEKSERPHINYEQFNSMNLFSNHFAILSDNSLMHVPTKKILTKFEKSQQIQCIFAEKIGSLNYVAVGFRNSPPKVISIAEELLSFQIRFTAPKLPHNRLNLAVQFDTTAICFIGRKSEELCLAVGDKSGVLRIYSISTKSDLSNRGSPVVELKFSNFPITLLAFSSEGNLLVGDSNGQLSFCRHQSGQSKIDMFGNLNGDRKGQVIDAEIIKNDSMDALVVSIDSDRYLRIFRLHDRVQLHKIFLTTNPTCMLTMKALMTSKNQEEDHIWDQMDVIVHK